MNRQKLVGRVAVIKKPGDSYIGYRLIACVKTNEWSHVTLQFSAQANTDEPNRIYAFQLESRLGLSEYEFSDSLAMIEKLQKAMIIEHAPRAVSVNGRAQLVHCELSQFLQGAEKLGLHVSWFDSWGEGYDWAKSYREEEKQLAEVRS